MSEKAYTAAVDLDQLTVPQLTALIAAAEAKRRDKLDGAKAALRAEMERRVVELGLSLEAVMQAPQRAPDGGDRSRKARQDSRDKVAAK